MRVFKTLALAFFCLLLATSPVIVGCAGGGDSDIKEIKYGWLWDFTGRAASAVLQTYDGFRDYLRMVSEEDPIEGLKLTLVTYDTKSDASRVPLGYEWMKGRGVDIMSAAPQDTELLRNKFEADQMPFYAISNIISMVDSQWLTSLYGPPELQLATLLEWISENWDNYPTKPKVGFIGLAGVPFYESQKETVQDWISAHPDKFEWLGAEMVPSTTTSWVSEVIKMKSADFIFASMSGPPLVSLTSEARARGYEGTFMGPSETYFSFYMLLRAGVSPADLDNCIAGTYTPWWGEDNAFMDEVEEYAQKYHSQASMVGIRQGTGQFNGWALGIIFIDAVKRAIDKVGVENLDGLAIHEALQATDMTVEGWGNPWKLKTDENINYFAQTVRLVEYRSDVDDWVAITEFEYPPSLD
jgi:hypothetical protein